MDKLINFVKDKLNVLIEYNPHKSFRVSVEVYTRDCIWADIKGKQKALDSNTLWLIEVYIGGTPGYYTYVAHDLNVLIDFVSTEPWKK